MAKNSSNPNESWTGKWTSVKTTTSEAIERSPNNAGLYEVRAMAHRNLGDLDAAIADFGRVVELDPHNDEAWMLRGACKTEKAALEKDRAKALTMMKDAHPDYRRAAELCPDSEQAGLALLELEICIGCYLEAVGTTGEWWDRIRDPSMKLVCAWLGAIAMILAGRPERRWAYLRDHLQSTRHKLEGGDWCIVEIDHHLKYLKTEPGIDLKQVKMIHELFLSRFRKPGAGEVDPFAVR